MAFEPGNLPPNNVDGFPLNPYAKGLLKPFYKGKGGMIRLRDELVAESDAMGQEAVNFEQRYNPWLNSIGIAVKRHKDKQQTATYLRWRDRGLKKMGDYFFERAMLWGDLSEPLRQQLYDIEVKRCQFNGRAGAINQELRNLRLAIERLERADRLLNREVE